MKRYGFGAIFAATAALAFASLSFGASAGASDGITGDLGLGGSNSTDGPANSNAGATGHLCFGILAPMPCGSSGGTSASGTPGGGNPGTPGGGNPGTGNPGTGDSSGGAGSVDLNGDGIADGNANVDADGNGNGNGNGNADANVDANGDGIADANVDADGNGNADANACLDSLNVSSDGPLSGSSLPTIGGLGAVLAAGALGFQHRRKKAGLSADPAQPTPPDEGGPCRTGEAPLPRSGLSCPPLDLGTKPEW